MNLPKNNLFFSLRGRLLLFLSLPLLVMLLISVGGDYRNAIYPTNEAYDRALAISAVALAALIKITDGKVSVDLPESAAMVLRTSPYDKIGYAILDGEKELIAGEKDLANLFYTDHDLANPAFHDEVLYGNQVRIATYRTVASGANVTVVVAESMLKRNQAV